MYYKYQKVNIINYLYALKNSQNPTSALTILLITHKKHQIQNMYVHTYIHKYVYTSITTTRTY